MPVRLSAAAFPGEFAKSQVRPENLQEMLDEWEVTDATSIIGQNLRTRSAESETGSFTGAWGPEDEEPDPPMVLLGVC